MMRIERARETVREKGVATTPCILCQSQNIEPLLQKKRESFVRCRDCFLIYQAPPPPPQVERAYYERGYYESFGDQVRPIQDARLPIYEDFVSEFTRYRQTGRLLDIGCGHGDFLKRIEASGWEGWGIEPSRQASQLAQQFLGERVLNQAVESTDFPEHHFDIITLWNVIDCLPDPVGALQKIQAWLRPGGLLVLRTPNSSFHLGIYRLYDRFNVLLRKGGWTREASVFLRSNFERKSLKHLLQKSGFCAVRIRNGKLTKGNAYQVFSRSSLMGVAKSMLEVTASFVGWVSGQRILFGPSLIARASPARGGSASGGKGIPGPQFLSRAMRLRLVLKSLVLHGLAVLGYLLGFPLWFKLLGKDRELRILLYHSINEFRKNDVNVRESQFRRQLDFLSAHCSVISLEQAVALLKEGTLPHKPSVALTFDDGYEDNYKIALPLLREKGFPATIFLLTGGEGPKRRLPHLVDDQPQYNQLLNWDQVREMAASRIDFGSHGQTHALLTQLKPEEVQREIFSSKERIESETGRSVQFFSYPYGTHCDFDRRVEWWVREGGYQAAFSKIFGTNGKQTNLYALRRIGVEASDSLFTFRAKLNGALGLLSLLDFPLIRRMIRWLDSLFLGGWSRSRQKGNPLLLVSVDFPPHTDGISTTSREMATRIARRGEPVVVIGPKDRGDREFDQAQPYHVVRVPGYEWGYLRFLPLLFWTPVTVFRYGIRKILAMNIAYGGVLTWLLSFFRDLEYLIFAHGHEFEKVKSTPLAQAVYLGIYRRAKRVMASSQFVKERLILFGVDARKIEVLYPTSDFERYRPLKVPREYLEKKGLEGRRLILTVGRLIERKGQDRVLEALPPIIQSFPNVLYGMVGIGEDEGRLWRLTQHLNLGNHVRFFGKVPDAELVLLYNACEIFVMPSREIPRRGHVEGLGMVFLEASACGKPVIGGRSGGIAEAIREGETGLLVDPDRPEEVAEKVVFLLSHPEQAEALGKKGARWVRENFSLERYAERNFEILYGRPLP